MNKRIFAAMLAEKRKSQKEMSQELHIRPQRISDMLSGRLMGWKYRSRIARYLEIPEDVLFPEN